MNFASPFYLLLLLAIPLLVILSFKQKKKTRIVPHLALWLTPEERAAPLPKRMAFYLSWPLFFMLMLLIAILALAHPYSGQLPSPTVAPLVILDNSFSMLTRDQGRSRLELAKQKLASFPRDTLLLTSGDLKFFTKAQLSAIDAVAQPESPKQAVALALKTREQRPVVLLSDATHHQWPGQIEFLQQQLEDNFFYTTLGQEVANLGIEVTLVERATVHYQVCSSYAQAQEVELIFSQGVTKESFSHQQTFRLQIPAHGKISRYLAVDPSKGRWLQLQLPAREGEKVKEDNQVLGKLPSPAQAKIVVLSDSKQPFLVAALGAYQGMISPQSRFIKGELPEEQQGEFDLAIICKHHWQAPAKLPARQLLFWGTKTELVPSLSSEFAQNNRVWKINNSDPLMKNLDLTLLQVTKSRVATQAQQVIVQGSHCPLIWRGGNQEFSYIYAAFQIQDSQLPILADFPLLLRNVLQEALQGKEGEKEELWQISQVEGHLTPRVPSHHKLPSFPVTAPPMYYREYLVVLLAVLVMGCFWFLR